MSISVPVSRRAGATPLRERVVVPAGTRAGLAGGRCDITVVATSNVDRPVTPTITLNAVQYGWRKRGQIGRLEKKGATPRDNLSGKTLIRRPDLASLGVVCLN